MNAGGRQRLADLAVVAASVAALAAYLVQAIQIVRYPWDWSPDEGLFLDYARRLITAPETLYGRSAVPFPASHGVLLPALLAPVVVLAGEAPLRGAHLVALTWTAGIAAAIYGLVRRRAPLPLALASTAVALAPADLTFWYLLVRVDGLMTAVWLLAAMVLLPARLERGADRLGTRRLLAGSCLLVASVLAKPTALLHGAPLVLGWLWVDRRDALRLAALTTALGLLVFTVLQVSTDGGFLWSQQLWAHHPRKMQWIGAHLATYLAATSLVLLLTLLGLLVALRAGLKPWRESAVLLIVGGVIVLPTLSKYGAWWNYLLPLLCATAILGGRLWAGAAPAARNAGALGTVAVALWLTASRPMPVPDPRATPTVEAFYAFVTRHVHTRGGPILALRPEYAYYLVGQATETEGTSFDILRRARVPGIEKVAERLADSRYTLVIAPRFPIGDYRRHYRWIGTCQLQSAVGPRRCALFVRQGDPATLDVPPGVHCEAPATPEVFR